MEYVVIKCGGSIFSQLSPAFYRSIVQLHNKGDAQPVLVHGGGPLISRTLSRLQVETQFVDGLRVTTEEVLEVAEMVLSGSMNKQLVLNLQQQGGKGFGLSGVDGGLLQAIQSDNAEIGLVGTVKNVQVSILHHLIDQGFIPVISPIGIDEKGKKLNINADVAAAAVAQALQAKLCYISDIPGILVRKNGRKTVLHETTSSQIEQLIADGTITGGMIPKVRSALQALKNQVPETVILNGLEPDSLLSFYQGAAVGTKISLTSEVGYV
ncbi:acetylglutamate kinase [Sediminibacillus halophilus]|uniref:Acetylglutamate kinase n=1 Tax=Sediminibacillus halophilus TaxID=482461 RepID=A0A1G9THE4_9BACI|nr:acetylglutamate kinase [Sediminibacillus halophilus]SDM47090.1 acetylglutamate kinase [Sediminibacillus halophilus]